MLLAPPSGPLPRFLDRAFVAGVRAASEGLFPPNALGVPDWRTTDLPARTEAYVRALPPSQRGLLMLLFAGVELLAPVLAPFGGRLSRRSPARRLALVEGWRASRVYPLRMLGDALRATLMMVWFSHPAALEAAGEPPRGAPIVGGAA